LLHDDALPLVVGAGRPALPLVAPLVHADAARPVCVGAGADAAGWDAGAGVGGAAGAGAGATGGGAAGWPTRVADDACAACACWRLRGDE